MNNFLRELTCEESGEFHNFCRMSIRDFEFLLNRIEPLIKKNDTQMRMAIPPKIRLAITLRYLATGDSYRSLHFLFKVSHQVISVIVPEVCRAIISVLKDQIKVSKKNSIKKKIYLKIIGSSIFEKQGNVHSEFKNAVSIILFPGVLMSSSDSILILFWGFDLLATFCESRLNIDLELCQLAVSSGMLIVTEDDGTVTGYGGVV